MHGRFLLLLLLPLTAVAQPKPSSGFKSLSCPEKWWVIWHPFVAKKAYRVSLEAREASAKEKTDTLLDGDDNGGQVDAFRHAYWMARLTQHMCWRKARSLGRAHEKGNYKAFQKGRMEEGTLPDSAACAMDLFNNDVGIEMGRRMENISPEAIQQAVRDSVRAGKMQVILKDNTGRALDCGRVAIDTVLYQGRWNIPKCLVVSDYKKKMMNNQR